MSLGSAKLRVMVAVKRVVDYAVKPRVSSDGKAIDLANVKMSMNPFCEIATEEAVKMKEAGIAGEVIAVSIGPKQAADTLRTALAMGADRALLLETPQRVDLELPHLHTAHALAQLVRAHQVDVLLTGKQAIDDDSALVPAMTAALLGAGQALSAAKVERLSEGEEAHSGKGGPAPRRLRVVREVDGGSQTVDVSLPAVISVDLRLNTPRYATLPNIMKAKKKPLDIRPLQDVLAEANIDGRPRLKVSEVRQPKERRAGVKVDSAEEIVRRLREEAKVI